MSFAVFTMDGRASSFDEGDGNVSCAAFILRWKEAAADLERTWPWAYTVDEDGKGEVVHFNPLLITAVSAPVPT